MEKPFRTDLASAKSLNAKLHEVSTRNRFFRIDHFWQGTGAKTFSRSASPTGSFSRSGP